MRLKCFALVIVFAYFTNCLLPAVKAQSFELADTKKRVSLPFRLVRNMIVIELMINAKGPYNFILDTGVGLMIITEPKLVDSINVSTKRTVQLFGWGEGESFEAYVVSALNVTMPDIQSQAVGAVIFKDDHFGLSNYAGMNIHGLLGFEFFNNLAVEINFQSGNINLCRPKDLKIPRRGEKLPITIENRKPYVESFLVLPNGVRRKSKLVVDIGAGHALSLENEMDHGKDFPRLPMANLGMGFTGPISGFVGRIIKIELGKYKFKKVITAFPQMDARIKENLTTMRDGNLGLGILKRFTITFNYQDGFMFLKPAVNFKEPFEHDMSGIEYFAGGVDFKHIVINRVEPGSAGDQAGLRKDDEILSINLKPVSNMSLEEIDNLFKSRDNRGLLLEIYRGKKYQNLLMILKRRI